MNILKSVREGRNVVFFNLGKSFDKYIEEDKYDYILLVPNVALLDKWSIDRLFSKYHLHEMFELSNCYLGTFDESYVLWHVSKKKPEYVKVSIFHGYAHDYRDDLCEKTTFRLPQSYRDNYKLYIKNVEEWADRDVTPSHIEECEFIKVPINEFDSMRPVPQYYRTIHDETRKLLQGESFLNLGDVAEVLTANMIDDANITAKVKVFDPEYSLKYPYIPELATIDGFASSEMVHKGDIIEIGNKFFLIDKESDFEIYAHFGTKIIRAKDISPEYLYLYLNSRTAKKIKNLLRVKSGNSTIILNGGSLNDFPIPIPRKDSSFYVEEFKKISMPNVRYYVIGKDKNIETIEDALEVELIEKIKINRQALIKRLIEKDVKELDVCFSNKAYKASLTLVGSILEAVLLDWLSEIRGINYFEENLKKRRYDKDLKCYVKDENGGYKYTQKNADLIDYIDEIRDIKNPSWRREADEAHKIRQKRNLVHPKKYLEENIEVDEALCKEVIQYLKNIINSRWQ